MSTKKRNSALDILRVIAAIAVAVFHVFTSSAHNDSMITEHTRTIITAFTETLRWHVPVFFMITGYLWLGSKKECEYKRIFLHIWRFIVVLFTVGFAYAILERFFSQRQLSLPLLAGGLFDVVNGNLWDHMWFLYSIIGVYLFLPVIKPLFELPSAKKAAILVGLLFIFTIIAPITEEMGYQIPISFPISEPAFYVCTGGLIAKIPFPNRKTGQITAALLVGSFTATFLITVMFPSAAVIYPFLTCIAAVSMFITVICFTVSMNENKYLRIFSDCTFGIYLFHPFFINLMIKLLHIYPLRLYPPFGILFTCVVIIALSFLFTFVLRKFRWIRQYL